MHTRQQSALLLRVVDGLYEAAAEPDRWVDVLDLCDQLFAANSTHIFHWNNTAAVRIAGFRSRSFADDHPEWDYYHRLNPRRDILRRLPPGTPMNCANYIDERSVQRSEFFNDYSLPAGRRFLLGVQPFHDLETTTSFAVTRGPHDRAFTTVDVNLVEYLVPHLQRVARVEHRLRAARTNCYQTTAALNKLADAILLTDKGGRIVRTNVAAERLFIKDGILRSISGRLHAVDDVHTERLRELIAQAACIKRDDAGKCGGSMILESPDGSRWGVTVVPLRPSATIFDLTDQHLALVVLSAIKASISLTDRLRQAFSLTQAEARLANQVIQGKRLDDIAAEGRVRVTTLRSQLKSVFSKTSTSRQAELVKLGDAFDKLRGDISED